MNIRISGSVQGVGFRYATLRTEVKKGVMGSIRNLYDGDVYIEAEGDSDQLKEFVSWCHEGPPHARVEKVAIREGRWQGFTDFHILP